MDPKQYKCGVCWDKKVIPKCSNGCCTQTCPFCGTAEAGYSLASGWEPPPPPACGGDLLEYKFGVTFTAELPGPSRMIVLKQE